jgi:hypothetical protein
MGSPDDSWWCDQSANFKSSLACRAEAVSMSNQPVYAQEGFDAAAFDFINSLRRRLVALAGIEPARSLQAHDFKFFTYTFNYLILLSFLSIKLCMCK